MNNKSNKNNNKEHGGRYVESRRLIANFYKHNKLNFIIAVVATVLNSVLLLMIAWILRLMMDTISGEANAKSLIELTWIIIIFLLALISVHLVEYAAKPRFMRTAVKQYKEYVLQKVMEKNIASFQSENTSAYLSALSNDINSIEKDYLEAQFQLISRCIMFGGSFIIMFTYSLLLTVIVIGLICLPVIASIFTGNKLEPVEKQVSENNAEFVSALKDCLSGFFNVKSFKSEKEFLRVLSASNAELEDVKCRKNRVKTLVGILGTVASMFAQFGVFFAGVWMVLTGYDITAGTVIAFVNLMNFVVTPIAEIPGLLGARKASVGLMKKISALLNLNSEDAGTAVMPAFQDRVCIQNLSFGYDDSKEVLHQISLDFEVGKSYAIVGTSGCGKSTLLHLLLGASASYTGNILYDSVEVKEISKDSLYDMISVIQQDVFIFNASIRDNVTMYRAFPDAEVEKAMKLANLHEVLKTHGEEYLCGEGGSGLSGGEKQRISIARSLLRKSSILLVDEATAALDAETAYQVSSDILDLANITRIVVTHSLESSLLRRYDKVIVMKEGKVEETGTFEELLEKKGYFHALYTVAQ